MIQFYFLAVALNIACGFALLLPERPHPRQLLRHLDFVLSDGKIRTALGILGLVTGLLTIISPIQGDVPIIGDLVPALTSALAGLVLLLELQPVHRDEATTPRSEVPGASVAQETPESPASKNGLRVLLVGSGRIIGLLAILAGLIHFFFPLELFL
ncbi:MAG TPA: hypothetical protein VMV44_01400 [Rectinemataceae bacterium]|nr:hypothetical protein [Rectinemataceae bacterium]